MRRRQSYYEAEQAARAAQAVKDAQADSQRTVETQDIEPPKPALTCPECGKSFKNTAGLRGHVRHKHTDGNTRDSD